MIGFVVVSHSAKLAEGVCELASQAAQGTVRLAAAGGTSDPANPIGTDAVKVLQAIESVYSQDGVLVLMDLGSAVLSAETALDLLPDDKRAHVHLCPAPLVEGTVAAVSQALAGAALDEILREAKAALAAKVAQLEPPAETPATGPWQEAVVTVPNPLGIHARPAAQLIRLARRFNAHVTIENLTQTAGPFDAFSINGILSLGARQGNQLRIRTQGPEAGRALVQLTEFVASGCGDRQESASPAPPTAFPASASGELTGIAASAGFAIGTLVKLRAAAVEVAPGTVDDPEAEWKLLQSAVRGAQDETRALYDWAKQHAGEYEAGIFDAQMLFLEDPELLHRASHNILARHSNAAWAWHTVTAALGHGYLQARAADVEDVRVRVLNRLTGTAGMAPRFDRPSIVSAHDLTPSEVKQLDPAMVLAVCLETGSASAHSVILIRAMAIPAVVGLGSAISALPDGTLLAVDGLRGRVCVSPSTDLAGDFQNRREAWLSRCRIARAERHNPACTRDGVRIRVLANLKSVAEAPLALDDGAEGVGVLRSEFLFLGRTEAPPEQEQFAAYHAVAETLGMRPLVIRTMDLGGEKGVPYVDFGKEANPVLGVRGIRVMLQRRDLLRTQLRAILRAGFGHAISIMFPMISSLAELRAARAALEEVEAELDQDGIPFDRNRKVGIMIEVPAAVVAADQLAREVDFFSIGTNDLIQYIMAADRTNARVASLADPFQPAVMRMIHQAIQAARTAGIGVALCGELAADPLATPLLIGLGLEEFSVSSALIPDLKQAIAHWSRPEAEAIAGELLRADSSEAARQYLSSLLHHAYSRPGV